MNEDYKRTIDRINHSTNEKIRSLHDDCSREMVNYMRSHSNAPETEIRSEIERITHKYNQGLHHYIAAAENEYRTYIGQYISRLSNVLGRDVNISYNTTGISQAKENIIREASDSFRENLNSYALSVSHRTLSASIEEEVHTFNTAGNELSSARSSSVDDIERLCSHITRASTTEGYMTISSLIGDIPEVMGYEVDVSPTDKYGRTRTVDICDHMKGEYPKDFKFTGWHPNCRCVIHPIIPDDMMTPALKAAGFIGRPRGSKITPPREALEYVKANRDKNPKFFDQFNAYRQVEYRGMPRTYMDMSLQDKLSFHIEDLSKITGKYLADLNQVEINITDDLPDDVFMSTVPKNGSYQISMRPSQAEDLSQVFSKRGLALPLTPSQIGVSADALHELTHSSSYDYTFGQSIEENVNKPMAALREKEEMLKNQNLSPEELEKEKTKIKNQRAKIERNRNIIIDYHHGFDPLEVGTLEMITEWEMRESFPGVMKQLGLTLPPDYAQYIKRGYNEPVSNFNLFINRIPADNIEAFRRSMHEILANPDKAFTQQRLQAAIKKSGALLKGSRPSQIVTAMQMNTPQEFEILLDNTALPPTRKAADVIDVDYTEVSSDIRKQGVSSKTLKNITQGTLAAGAVSVISSAAGSVIDPERDYQDVRYIPEVLYKGDYTRSIMAGAMDRALNSVEDAYYIFKDLAVFQFYSMYMPFSSKTREMKQNFKSSMGDLGEFIMMLTTDGEFRGQIWNLIKTEFSEYIDSIAGFSPEHGYAQGQLIFDIVSMFVGVGEVKATLASFKNTKSIVLLEKEIKKRKVAIKKLLNKKLPKTEKPKALPAPADTPPAPKPKQLPAPQPESTTIKKLPSGAELIKENNSISLNTGYIQNKKAVKHNFITYGKKLRGKGYLNFKNKIYDINIEEKHTKTMYRSGSTLPKVINVTDGMELYKIVPKNNIIHKRTPYWLTKNELIKIFNNERGIEDMLALPEGSCKGIYDIYKITLKNNQNIKNIRIFESRIAPSRQGTIKRKGGAKQILVPNRDEWSDAVKIEELKIE